MRGKHRAKVPAIDRRQRPPGGKRKLQDRYTAAWLADANHLGQPGQSIAHVAQSECHRDDLKMIVWKGKSLGVGFDERDLRSGRRRCRVRTRVFWLVPNQPPCLGSAADQHRMAKIGPDDGHLPASGAPIG